MVDLQNLKNAINEGGFSEEAKAIMLPIIDAAIARGSMTAAEKQKLADIMDVEIDQDTLAQSAHEDAAEAIGAFLAEVDAAAETADTNIDALTKESDEESKKIQDDLKNSAQIPASPEPMAAPAMEAPAMPQPMTTEPMAPSMSTPEPTVPPATVTETPPETPAQ